MKRTPLWDQTFDGLLAYIAEVKPKPPARQLIHVGNKQADLLKTESELEIWELFENGLTALKMDAKSDSCGDLKSAANAASLRSSNIAKTLNISVLYGRHESQQDDQDKQKRTADDRSAFEDIQKLMQMMTGDLQQSRTLLIDALNKSRRRDLGVRSEHSLQDIFQSAQKEDAGNPLIVGTDLHREMAEKLKEMVNAYRRIHADITAQINKVSPYAPKTDDITPQELSGMNAPKKPAARFII